MEMYNLSQRQIYQRAIVLRNQGRLYNLQNPKHEDTFRGSIDRFSEIAYRLRHAKEILDVGAGSGILISLLSELGHKCYALDITDMPEIVPEIYKKKRINFQKCNVEIDDIPHPENYFDGVVCCQVLEHFTHSHLGAMREMYRVLKYGGILEVDVPNAVCFRNRSRMIRGKHITWDYKKHYLYAKPIQYKGLSFYPNRHNREFTKNELKILLEASGFKTIDIHFLKSRRYRGGLEVIYSLAAMVRDLIPSLRKSIIAFAEKR